MCVAGQGSQDKKRRRRLRASVFALALPLSLGPGWALWAAVPKASGPIQGPQRKLLGSVLQVRLSRLRAGDTAWGSAGPFPPHSSNKCPRCVWMGGAGLGLVFVGRNLLEAEKDWSGMHGGLLGGAECITCSHRTILKSLATCWVALQPSAPGLPGSPHSPES